MSKILKMKNCFSILRRRNMCRVWIPDVVGDGPNADSNLISVASLLHITGQSGDGERRPVDLGHEEPPQDDLVELSIRCPGPWAQSYGLYGPCCGGYQHP